MWLRDWEVEMPLGPSVGSSISSSLSISLNGSESGLQTNDDKRNQKIMWGRQSFGLTQSITPPLYRKHSIQVVE